MQAQVSVPRDGIVVAHGYGLKIYVERGHLVVHDGICDERQTCRYNRATGACGGSCDLRTINLASGSIFIDEFFSNGTCPGVCQPNPAGPSAGTLNDVIVGGTGIFAGASGNVSGSVSASGPESVIRLAGTITLTV
jgi:hypothetical protein